MFAKAGENWPKERYESFIPPQEIAEIIIYMLEREHQVWMPEVRIESK
jgi:NADP-dependent 3-hydroxy acid dehydrogenase YdfG